MPFRKYYLNNVIYLLIMNLNVQILLHSKPVCLPQAGIIGWLKNNKLIINYPTPRPLLIRGGDFYNYIKSTHFERSGGNNWVFLSFKISPILRKTKK